MRENERMSQGLRALKQFVCRCPLASAHQHHCRLLHNPKIGTHTTVNFMFFFLLFNFIYIFAFRFRFVD